MFQGVSESLKGFVRISGGVKRLGEVCGSFRGFHELNAQDDS